ncbi:hypothetical protein [Flavobacterium sp.]|uniref:hypothetical protein n=1 Tax=Flavobacterium sp. TaxID=239 RepID=UPI00391917CE
MKTTRILRFLSLLGFLLLLAPFYDACDDKTNGFVKTYDEYDTNGKLIEKTFLQEVYNIVVDELSFNGFEIASLSVYAIQDLTFKDFKEEVASSFKKEKWFKDLGMFISFLFDTIILISLTLIILSFTKRIQTLNKLALINTFLILLTLSYIIFLESSFDHIRQIKWGYYVFIITNLLIFYYSKLASKQQNS